jgi:NAD(P)H-dependent FMN reductase
VTRIQVVVGSTRPGRFAEKPAGWVHAHLDAREDLDAELVDLRDYPLPFYEQDRPPAYTGREYLSDAAARFGGKIDEADGYVIVGPEYNHGYSAVLKNAIDHTFVEWRRKPVAFVGYGNTGGARAIEQLRQVVVELEMAPLRHAIHITPDLMRPAMQSGDPAGEGIFAPLQPRLELLADDLAWWARTLAVARRADPGS